MDRADPLNATPPLHQNSGRSTDGNIFGLKDGQVMITMISACRQTRKVQGYTENLEVSCRLPDASNMRRIKATAIDMGETWALNAALDGATLNFTVPRHAKATVVLLSAV